MAQQHLCSMILSVPFLNHSDRTESHSLSDPWLCSLVCEMGLEGVPRLPGVQELLMHLATWFLPVFT